VSPLARLDAWVGRALFVPLIVRFCQWSGWSQFAVHNYLYLIGAYMLLAAYIQKGSGGQLAFVLAFVLTWKIGRNPGYRGEESKFLRRAFLVLEAFHVAAHVTGEPFLLAGPDWDLSCPVSLMWLAAEYARTIKTIPPLEEPEPKRVFGEVV
jgi:hypothetical protein